MTDTLRIAYRWADRNGIGEPLEVVRYGSRQWETGNDEDEALAQACSGLRLQRQEWWHGQEPVLQNLQVDSLRTTTRTGTYSRPVPTRASATRQICSLPAPFW